MKLSLIITTYNNPIFLEMVLLSLQHQQLREINCNNIEVLIADDGSKIDTKHVVEKYQEVLPFNLIHVWHEDKGFRASAIRNIAVTKSSGEYLVFIDGDCILQADFIYNHIKLTEAKYCVAGNRVLLSRNYTNKIADTLDISILYRGLFGYILCKLNGKINKFLPCLRLSTNAKWRKSRQMDWKLPKSCNLGVWRCDYIGVNGFDESFSGWGHEDSDLIVRLLHFGVKIKDGRFSVPVFHLWHKQNSRANTNANYQRLMKRVANYEFVCAEIGLAELQKVL